MRLLFVSNLLIFCVQLASGVLPKHVIREISGLDKANRFVLPVTANGEVSSEPFPPNVSQPCKDALRKPLTQLIRCKYDHFIFAMFCLQVNYLNTNTLPQAYILLAKSGAPNENIVQNHLNIAWLNVL